MDRNSLLKKHWYHFLAPKYWLLWIAFGILRLSVFLPYSALLVIGKTVGILAMYVVPKRKDITAVNLKLCFPELSEIERGKLLKRCFESMGIGVFETALAWWASDARVRKMLTFKGREHLDEAERKKKGIIVITCHFTSIELGIRLFSLFKTTNLMYRPQKNIFSEWVLQKNRAKFVKTSIPKRDIKGMLKILKTPHALTGYTPDQDPGRRASVFAPFFGVNTCTVIGANTFIKRTNCAVMPVFYYRDEKTRKYIIDCQPLLENFPTGDDIADATLINKILEEGIKKAPEQYFWQHRRFKTRPLDEVNNSFYEN